LTGGAVVIVMLRLARVHCTPRPQRLLEPTNDTAWTVNFELCHGILERDRAKG
jgi:hypothetical protein